MLVTCSQTCCANNHNTTVAPATITLMCRRSWWILHTTQQAVELAPAPAPPPAPPLRRSKHLQGQPPSPPPPEEPPRAWAPACPQLITPPPAPRPLGHPPQWQQATFTSHQCNRELPEWSLINHQQWHWAIPAYDTGHQVDVLADTINIHHTRRIHQYPLVPARHIVEGPNYRDEHQPTVDEGYLWDMI